MIMVEQVYEEKEYGGFCCRHGGSVGFGFGSISTPGERERSIWFLTLIMLN